MANFEEIDRARKLLGLGEVASLKEIKAAYGRLARRHHPDLGHTDKDHKEAMRELNWAYELLEDYCSNYRYSFGEKEVARAYPNEAYRKWWRENWPI